jgi:hypothetical protein
MQRRAVLGGGLDGSCHAWHPATEAAALNREFGPRRRRAAKADQP